MVGLVSTAIRLIKINACMRPLFSWGEKTVATKVVNNMVTSLFEEWMDDYEAKLRDGVQKRFGLSDRVDNKSRLDDEKQEKDKEQSPA
jgi:hypothetical protein